MTSTVSHSQPTDEQLAADVARCVKSARTMGAAREAFDQLYQRHAPLLLAFLSRRVHDSDLEDVHQEIWRRAWEHLPDQFHDGHFRAWLYQIARNLLIDQGKKRKAERISDPEFILDGQAGAAHERLLEHERTEILRGCLEKLDPKAAALVKARLAGDDYPEACQRLGLKAESAYKLFHKAKEQLTNCVERALG